jgi:SsrA-binding protein
LRCSVNAFVLLAQWGESNFRSLPRASRLPRALAPGAFLMPPKDSPRSTEKTSIARNKRARFDYEILDRWEAGIVLTGTEVKSLREGKANIGDAYGVVRDGEIYLINMHISPYERGGYANHEPDRTRKLLLHKKEIRRLIGAVERQGLTLIPLELYFKHGVAKVALALGRGKKLHDKRDTERRRDAEREMARAVRAR